MVSLPDGVWVHSGYRFFAGGTIPSLHGSLTLAPPAVNCFLRSQHIGQGEDGLADEVEQLRRAGEQQTEIEAQQKGGQSALDGHGQHIDVEL